MTKLAKKPPAKKAAKSNLLARPRLPVPQPDQTRLPGGFFIGRQEWDNGRWLPLPLVIHRLKIAMSIQLIVGLGNPGPEYEQTRHNAGFWLVDNLALRAGARLARESRFNALAAKARVGSQEAWLLEPQTFMNRSGQSVGALARFYKIAPENVLVVHDELDLAPGVAKIKKGGSAGGHNGLKDISAALGTQDYWRLRIGIGHPRSQQSQQAVVDYVLHRPRKEEQGLIEEAVFKSLDVIGLLCEGKFEAAMMQLHTQATAAAPSKQAAPPA